MKHEDYPKTRHEARALGLKHFFTNKVCINNHLDLRTVHSGACVLCRRNYTRKRAIKQRQNPAFKAYQKKYQAKYRLTERGKETISKAQEKYNNKLKALKDDITKTNSS